MEKRIMHIISGMLLVVALLSMTGCGKSGHAESQRTDTGTDAGMQTYSVYYMNQKWTEFSVYDTKIDQLESTENVIDKLMNLLISTEDEQLYKIPVADGMTYQRYSYDGKGLVTIMFNLDYDTAENYQILLCKMAFTKTLCQVNHACVRHITSVLYETLNLEKRCQIVPHLFISMSPSKHIAEYQEINNGYTV